MMSQKTKEMSCRKANIKVITSLLAFSCRHLLLVFVRKILNEFMCREEEFGIFMIVVGLDTENCDRSG